MARALRLAQAFSNQAGLSAGRAGDLAVIVEEWVANVVEHGGSSLEARISLRLALHPHAVLIAFSDAGRPFDPRAVAFEGPNAERGGGAGLAMITSLSRLTAYARKDGRNRLRLELPLA